MSVLVSLACIVVLTTSAAAFTVPEETVTDYYNTIFLPIDVLTQNAAQLDQRWCRAYAMLADETKTALSADEFGRALWVQRMTWGRRDMIVGAATYSDQKTMAKVPLTLRLQSWTGADPRSQHSIITLTKAQDAWRIILSAEQLANYRAAAKQSSRKVSCP